MISDVICSVGYMCIVMFFVNIGEEWAELLLYMF